MEKMANKSRHLRKFEKGWDFYGYSYDEEIREGYTLGAMRL